MALINEIRSLFVLLFMKGLGIDVE